MGGVHAKYSMSNAHRILACPGQVRLAASLPDNETPESREGTFVHALLEHCIKNDLSANTMVGLPLLGRQVQQHHADSVMHVLDYIALLRAEYPDLLVLSEARVTYPQKIVPEEDAGGTLDVLAASEAANRVWIIDFKNGAGVKVDADQNKQLMGYARCIQWINKERPTAFDCVIIQPNLWNYVEPRVFVATWLDLFEFDADFQKAIAAAERPDAPRVPGPHCRMCKAAAVCSERESTALQAMQAPVAGFTPPDPKTIDLVRLGAIVAEADNVRQWLSDCKKLAETIALGGVHVPGNKLVQAKPRRAYARDKTPDQMADALLASAGGRLTIDDVMPRKLVPLTKAEALLVAAYREGAPPELKRQASEDAHTALAFLTVRDTTGALSLVPERDPRPAYVNNALDDFSGVVAYTG